MSEREISPLEDKLLSQAVANTETEIFRSAMDVSDPDESEEGDRSVEEMGEGLEGQHEAEVAEDDDQGEGEEDGADKGEGEQEAERDDNGRFKATEQQKPGKTEGDDKGRMVPRSRLTEEANKRREIEDARKADQERHTSEIAALNRRLDEIARSQQPQSQQSAKVEPKAEPVAKPDQFTEPEKWEAWVLDQARSQATAEAANVFTQRFVEASMADAHDAHGEEFVRAYEDLTGINPVTQQAVRQIDKNDPVTRAEVARVLSAPNPGRALMSRYRQQAAMREVGTDPTKYVERVRNETRDSLMKDPDFRKEILASLKAEAAQGNNGSPRTVTRFPKSLTDVSGGQSAQHRDPSDFDNSDEGVFESVWSSRSA
jgi:hypothetical protein